MGVLEEQRSLCEDLERLEQACADRILEEPKTIRERLTRDHQIAKFVDRFEQQSTRLLELRADIDGARQKEIDALSTGDPFDEFYRQLSQLKEFHRKYPNEPVENLERAYKRRTSADGELGSEIDTMFTGEESNGRFFDLMRAHEEYLNLQGVKRITYLQYLSLYDKFDGFTKGQKLNDKYFQYLNSVANYLESFLKRTRPLQNPTKLLEIIGNEFEKAWAEDKVPGWGAAAAVGPVAPSQEPDSKKGEYYCVVCVQSFSNPNVYEHHFTAKKHKKAEAKLKAESATANGGNDEEEAKKKRELAKLKDRAVAEREWRIAKLTELMKKEREATLTNVERKQSLTERERQMELEALYKESTAEPTNDKSNSEDEDDDSKIYNPLKLPLAWDGKPIPYWLYKLHGLGVEFPCEICGNFVYMGRRAFDKHFNEYRHTHGLRCLGITNTSLFREITKIDEAQRLWEKLESDKKKAKQANETVEEMEDGQGNVMPRKVYEDLRKQGLLD
ncbi:Pre-mRNA-splicing factor sap61 [Rhizina undulata]